jgi:hypothetical protein
MKHQFECTEIYLVACRLKLIICRLVMHLQNPPLLAPYRILFKGKLKEVPAHSC